MVHQYMPQIFHGPILNVQSLNVGFVIVLMLMAVLKIIVMSLGNTEALHIKIVISKLN